jgi:hypothetical protein
MSHLLPGMRAMASEKKVAEKDTKMQTNTVMRIGSTIPWTHEEIMRI